LNVGRSRVLIPIAIVCLLLGGMLVPLLVLGQTGTQSQLSAMVSSAEKSRSYAYAVIGYASAEGLSVSTAQSLLSKGDALLSAAQADASSGSNITGGLESARAAMQDYTSAAATASLSLSDAGLGTSVDYAAAEDAIADVNSTAEVMASVAATACANGAASGSGSGTLAQACAQLATNLSAARSSLDMAATLAAQANGQAGASANYSQVISLVAAARGDLNSTQAEVSSIASSSYVLRADGYVEAVIDPVSLQANSTIAAETSTNSSFFQFQDAFATYTQTQSSSVQSLNASSSALESAVGSVNTGAVSSDIGSADRVTAELDSNLTALLQLPGISLLTSVVADIGACQTNATNYDQATASALSESDSYSQTTISQFAGYVSAMTTDEGAVQSKGAAYVSAYQKVTSDLSSLQIPGVSAILDNLLALQVSGSVSGVDSALTEETSAMATVQTDISSFSTTVSAQSSNAEVPASLETAAAVAASAEVYLNSTGASAMAAISSALQSTAEAAQSFTADASACLTSTVGAFSSSQQTLSSSGSALKVQTTATAAAISSGGANLAGALQARLSSRSAGQGEVAASLNYFSDGDVADGVSAMEQAYVSFQAASTVGAQ
jgi:hypothetical protein